MSLHNEETKEQSISFLVDEMRPAHRASSCTLSYSNLSVIGIMTFIAGLLCMRLWDDIFDVEGDSWCYPMHGEFSMLLTTQF